MALPWSVSAIDILNGLAVGFGVEVTRCIRFADGKRGLLDVYAPKGAAGAPMVVFFYGGGWESGERRDYRFAAVALARCGFVVAVPDYRVYPPARFPDFLPDGAKAVRWARRHAEEFGGDPGLLTLIGHSAGAYIAAMIALDPQWLDAQSMAALAGVVGLAGPYDFLPLHSRVLEEIFKPAGDLALTQPVTFARGDAAPMLLITGSADKVVRAENSRSLAARLRALGGDVQTKIYQRVDHSMILGVFSPVLRSFAPTLRDTAAFIERRVGVLRPKPGSPRFFRSSLLP